MGVNLRPLCDDGDPCTVDLLHPRRGQCVHMPDALCTKPCERAEDCAFAEGLAPCLQFTCAAGACRYMRIAADECVRCGPDAPCQGTFCDPRACRQGFCRHAPRSCDDGDPATWDRCDDTREACTHLLADGVRACQTDAECRTDHPCQRLTCQDTRCRLTRETAQCGDPRGRPRTCRGNLDCIHREGGVCYAGPCRNGFCALRDVPNSPDCAPCTGDQDCRGTFCEWPMCTGTVCTVESVPFCADMDPDTRDICSNELRGCIHEHVRTPAVCQSPPADDGDPGTVDACDATTGETRHLPAAPGRCATTDRCVHVYTGPDGFCLAHPVVCKHDDACPAYCDPARGCVLDENRDCHCQTDADCDLGSPCARVFCMAEDGGACWGTFLDDCIPCRSDADCRVDDWCILGRCNSAGYCDYQDGFTCDDGDPETFGFCHGQRDDPCTHEDIVRTRPNGP